MFAQHGPHWTQPDDWRGQLPDTWDPDATRMWQQDRLPDPPRHALVSERDESILDTALTRSAVRTGSIALIVAGITLIAVCLRILWAVWPR